MPLAAKKVIIQQRMAHKQADPKAPHQVLANCLL